MQHTDIEEVKQPTTHEIELHYDYKANLKIGPPTPLDEKEKVATGDVLLIGDLHGNPLKLLYILARHQIIKFKNDNTYERFADFCLADPNKLTEEDIKLFHNLLNEVEIVPGAGQIRLMGDLLADRGQNDYFTLKVIETIQEKSKGKIIEDIICSNHDDIFMHRIMNNEKAYEDYNTKDSQYRSVFNLEKLIAKGLVKKDEVEKIIHKYYAPKVKLISYEVSDEKPKKLKIYTHAPALFLKELNKLIDGYEIKPPLDGTIQRLLETIDKINYLYKAQFIAGRTSLQDADSFLWARHNSQKMECDLFLMSAPTNNKFKRSDQKHLYLYKDKAKKEFFYIIENKIHYLKDIDVPQQLKDKKDEEFKNAKCTDDTIYTPILAEEAKKQFSEHLPSSYDGYEIEFITGHDTKDLQNHPDKSDSLLPHMKTLDNTFGRKSAKGKTYFYGISDVSKPERILVAAVQNGKLAELENLLKQKEPLDIEKKYAHGETLATIAAKNGQVKILQYLAEQKANLGQQDIHGNTLAHIAAEHGHVEILKILVAKNKQILKMPNKMGSTPALFAALGGNVATMQYLIEEQADLNKENTVNKSTPVFAAVQNNHLDILQLIINSKLEVDFNKTHACGFTPIMFAAEKDRGEIFTLLLEAKVNVTEDERKNIATQAAEKGHSSILTALKKDEHKKTDDHKKTATQEAKKGNFSILTTLDVKEFADEKGKFHPGTDETVKKFYTLQHLEKYIQENRSDKKWDTKWDTKATAVLAKQLDIIGQARKNNTWDDAWYQITKLVEGNKPKNKPAYNPFKLFGKTQREHRRQFFEWFKSPDTLNQNLTSPPEEKPALQPAKQQKQGR